MMVGAEMDSADPCQELMDHPWPTIQLMCKSSHPLRSHSWILRELNCRAVGMNATEGTAGKDDEEWRKQNGFKDTIYGDQSGFDGPPGTEGNPASKQGQFASHRRDS